MNEDTRALIVAAFEVAAKSGRSDGMTAAVLKNRMMQLSAGGFDEKELGFESFSAFLAANTDDLEIDRSARPVLVRLRGQVPVSQKPTPEESVRIRPDLWRAVMDYSSSAVYAWNPESGLAERAEVGGDPSFVLPTLVPAELHDLRSRFEAKHRAAGTETERVRLAAWLDNDLGTSALPPRLRGIWNHVLKEAAQERLVGWFAQRGIVPPKIVQIGEVRERRKVDELRDWVRAVVDVMSDEELRALDLPAGATFRAGRR